MAERSVSAHEGNGTSAEGSAVTTAAAARKDVSSPQSIVDAVYEILSGRAGEPRDWDRWRTLYIPDARLIPVESNGDGVVAPRVLDPDEYIESRSSMLAADDFFEWETEHEELRFGSVAHVWSFYEAARTPGGEAIRHGANSIQLWHDGTRWWIVSVLWDAVSAAQVTDSG
jgi:hypothetical protein